MADGAIPLPPRRPRARVSEDQFTQTAAALGGLWVDGTDLVAINRYLDLLGELTRITRTSVGEADRAAQMVDDPRPDQHRYASLGSDEIGGVIDVSVRLSAATQAVENNLAALAAAVEGTADAVAKIAKLYESTDQRNRLDAEQVRRYLTS